MGVLQCYSLKQCDGLRLVGQGILWPTPPRCRAPGAAGAATTAGRSPRTRAARSPAAPGRMGWWLWGVDPEKSFQRLEEAQDRWLQTKESRKVIIKSNKFEYADIHVCVYVYVVAVFLWHTRGSHLQI